MEHKISLPTSSLAKRLEVYINALKPYEVIEIKLKDNKVGLVSITVKKTYQEIVELDRCNLI